jgi:PEGA domain
MSLRRAVSALACCAALGSSTWAAAQPARADELLAKGRQALLEDRPRDAWRLFELGLSQAAEGEPRWRMLLGLALAYELDGAGLDAIRAYRRFLGETLDHPDAAEGKWSRRRDQALEDVLRLEQAVLDTHTKVDVRTEPAGARVVIDGEPTAERTPAVVYLTPGHHEIGFELDGFERSTLSLDAVTGERPKIERRLTLASTVAAEPEPQRPPSSPGLARPAPATATTDEGVDLLVPGAITLSIGAAIVVAAGALHWSALRDADEVKNLQRVPANVARDRELRDRIQAYQSAYVTSYVVGGLATGAGVTMLLIDTLGGDDAAGDDLGGWLSPTGAGLYGRF